MGSDLEKKSVSRRLSHEMWSSTREEGVPDGTGRGGCPYPAIAQDEGPGREGLHNVYPGLTFLASDRRDLSDL